MPRGRKKGELRALPEPKWCIPFLEALTLTGNVAAAAEISGIDVTGAYRRRTRDAGFRAQWAAVLAAREARASGVAGEAAVAVAGEPVSAGVTAKAALMALEPRVTASGVKLARPGTARWSKKVEAKYLAALASCANAAHAARSVGFPRRRWRGGG